MTVVEEIKEKLDKFNLDKQILVERLRIEFPKILTPIMQKSKIIKSIGWTQYTPYFNDGDSCTFSVHHEYDLYVNDVYASDERSQVNIDHPTKWSKLNTEDDVKMNNYLSIMYSRPHLSNRTVGQEGLLKDPTYNDEEGAIYEEIKSVLKSIPEEFYLELFGDHCKVTIYLDGGIDVTEYSHD